MLPPSFPLVETHLHLEGSIPPRVLGRLARRAGRTIPPGRLRPGRPLQARRGFGDFLDAFVFCAALLRDGRDVEEATSALLDDLRAEGVLYAEITFSPQVHLRRGLSLPEVMAALARARGRARRLGGPEVAYIADGARLWGPGWLEALVDEAAAHARDGLVAVGLGGDERAAPARGFRRALDRARASGLGVVVHAGEGTSPAAVREAVDVLGVSRIAHGVAAVADPALLERLARGGVLLEICPTSNVMTGAARGLGLHPLPRILAAGVRVALGSDDRTIFGTTLRREYARAAAMGVPDGAARAMVEAAAESSFAPAGLRRRLVRRIRAAPPAGG